MRLRSLLASALALFLATQFCLAGGSGDWAGQYTDKKFLGGRAVFQLSIEQSGSAMQVSFDCAWVDGHGAAPEAEGPATLSGNTLTFKFEDTFGNTGTGTISRTPGGIIVSLNPTHVAEARCLAFYGKSMHLRRVTK
jgi:hypothetical protein